MKWSKLKKSLESLLAKAVKDHVQFHMTRYGPGVSEIMARAWITWDKEQLVNMSNVEWLVKTLAIEPQLRAVDCTTRAQGATERSVHQEAKEIVHHEGLLSRFQFVESAEQYIGLAIEDALRSDNPIVQAIAMFDRRVGKRRLQQIHLEEEAHPLVKLFYALRCRAEGLGDEQVTRV